MKYRLINSALLFCLLALGSPALAQTLSLSDATGAPGETVSININFAKEGQNVLDLDFATSVVSVSPPLTFAANVNSVCLDPTKFESVSDGNNGLAVGACAVNGNFTSVTFTLAV